MLFPVYNFSQNDRRLPVSKKSRRRKHGHGRQNENQPEVMTHTGSYQGTSHGTSELVTGWLIPNVDESYKKMSNNMTHNEDVQSIISKLLPDLAGMGNRVIWWQLRRSCIRNESESEYEMEIRRDGIDYEFIPIENIIKTINENQGID